MFKSLVHSLEKRGIKPLIHIHVKYNTVTWGTGSGEEGKYASVRVYPDGKIFTLTWDGYTPSGYIEGLLPTWHALRRIKLV